jgi:hypothetical protein
MSNFVLTVYAALFIAQAAMITSAKLSRSGYSIDRLQPSRRALFSVVVLIPFAFVANFGTIGVSLWAFRFLQWPILLGIAFASVIVWGLIMTRFLFRANYDYDRQDLLAQSGVWIEAIANVVAASCTGFVAWILWNAPESLSYWGN